MPKKIKNRSGNNRRIFLCRLWLVMTFLLCVDIFPAFSIDFITREEFKAEKNAYKDYPLKILFKKLNESSGAEKNKIRNVIILKQIFDPNMREQAKSGAIRYKKYFGIIQEITPSKLTIWLPKTNQYQNFHVGIDRIPLENVRKYEIQDLNLIQYASIVHTLDNRIYKIEISFPPTAPAGLYVQRSGGENIVGWDKPGADLKPTTYNVFMNGTFFAEVKGFQVKIPRKKSRVDKYYVTARYMHGNGFVDSGPSREIYDHITAAEIKEETLAAEAYTLLLAALTPADWQKGRAMINEHQLLFTEALTPEQLAAVNNLNTLFGDIDQGVRLSRLQPESIANLDQADAYFKKAALKANAMPSAIDVRFLPNMMLTDNKSRRAALEKRQKNILAAAAVPKKPAPVKIAQPQIPEQKLDRKALSKQARGDFKNKNYESAFSTYSMAFNRQIDHITKGGSKQISGLLSLPPRYRAEIVFLIELDQLRKKYNNDQGLIRSGLEELSQRIDEKQGLWVVVPEVRRERIREVIENY